MSSYCYIGSKAHTGRTVMLVKNSRCTNSYLTMHEVNSRICKVRSVDKERELCALPVLGRLRSALMQNPSL